MAVVHLTYTIAQTIPAAGAYMVEFQVVDAQNIDPQIFVFDSAYQGFTGVATPYDMLTWPVVPDPNLMSFRSTGVVRTYATPQTAEYFVTVTRGRIEALREAWETYINEFEANTTVVLP